MRSEPLAQGHVQQLASLLEARMGWSLAPGDVHRVEHGLRNMARHQGFSTTAECADWLLRDPWSADKEDACAYFLTVGETYFFREKRAFDLIVDCARERLAAGDAPLRIWSAGCCTGEEPYSAAMALLEAFPQLRPGAVSILATDVSRRNLDIARQGRYRKWSFRGRQARIRERYFSEDSEGMLRVSPQVRALVQFAELNLAMPSYPSPANGTAGIDVILCRNVLMYFTPAQRRQVVQRLRASLNEGGWLVVNASEASSELFEGFSPASYDDAIHYRKTGPATAAAKAAPAMPPSLPVPAPAPRRRAAAPAAAPKHAPAAADPAPAAEPAAAGGGGVDELRARAASALSAGDIERARTFLQQLVFLRPHDVAAHYLMGMALAQAGRDAQARRKFEVAAELLEGTEDAEPVPGTEGLPAGYLRASLRTLLAKGHAR